MARNFALMLGHTTHSNSPKLFAERGKESSNQLLLVISKFFHPWSHVRPLLWLGASRLDLRLSRGRCRTSWHRLASSSSKRVRCLGIRGASTNRSLGSLLLLRSLCRKLVSQEHHCISALDLTYLVPSPDGFE